MESCVGFEDKAGYSCSLMEPGTFEVALQVESFIVLLVHILLSTQIIVIMGLGCAPAAQEPLLMDSP